MFYCKRILRGTKWCEGLPRFVLLGFLALFLILSCSKDVEPKPDNEPDPQQQEDPKPEDPQPEDPKTTDDPDVLSEYLVMTGASKITGSPPQANDGQLKINIKDTAYAVKGHPLAAPRMLIKKQVGLEISSYNVQVGGASFYYNFPAEIPENPDPVEADSLDVLVLDVQPPDNVTFPLSLDVKIQPLDASGMPLDEFNKVITVEDPNASGCSIMAPNPCPGMHPADCGGLPNWMWGSTFDHSTGRHIVPGLWNYAPTWKTIGCCIGEGESVFEFQDHRCRPDGNNLEYKELDVSFTGYLREPFHLGLYDDGEFYTGSGTLTQNLDSENMNFCEGGVRYIEHKESGFLGGTHDYREGADFINLSYDPNFDTGGTRHFWAGEIIFKTCNTLMIRVPDPEGDFGLEVTHVLKKYKQLEPLTVTITITYHD
ncbi:MAG: hypothetical protein AB3N14_17155 [Flavobacteriaceae bacterium]